MSYKNSLDSLMEIEKEIERGLDDCDTMEGVYPVDFVRNLGDVIYWLSEISNVGDEFKRAATTLAFTCKEYERTFNGLNENMRYMPSAIRVEAIECNS